MTDFRVLCADLLAWAEKASAHYYQQPDALVRARAALAAEADGPAVPEGREPAAVVGKPSDEKLLELAQFHCVSYTLSDGTVVSRYTEDTDIRSEVLSFARAVLALAGHQPAPPAEDDCPACECVPKPGSQPCAVCGRPALAAEAVVEGPSLEEVECLCEEHCFNVEGYESIECLQGLINEAITRWGRPTPVPAEGEVAELVAWLRANALTVQKASGNPANGAKQRMNRAADLLSQRHPVPVPVAIPGEKYHEDMGAVTWWRLPFDEPPWVGTPNDSDWPGYHTHFTPAPPEPATALPLPAGEGE